MRLARLKARADFLRVAASGRKCVRPGLILQVALQPRDGSAANELHDDPRVGFTVTRKVGDAVKRNRARRRLRAAAADILSQGAKRGHDYVLIARRETLRRDFADLLSDLTGALRTLGAGEDRARSVRQSG